MGSTPGATRAAIEAHVSPSTTTTVPDSPTDVSATTAGFAEALAAEVRPSQSDAGGAPWTPRTRTTRRIIAMMAVTAAIDSGSAEVVAFDSTSCRCRGRQLGTPTAAADSRRRGFCVAEPRVGPSRDGRVGDGRVGDGRVGESNATMTNSFLKGCDSAGRHRMRTRRRHEERPPERSRLVDEWVGAADPNGAATPTLLEVLPPATPAERVFEHSTRTLVRLQPRRRTIVRHAQRTKNSGESEHLYADV